MLHTRQMIVAVLLCLVVNGMFAVVGSFAEPPIVSSEPVFVIGVGTVVGESTLQRQADALWASLRTTELTPSYAYTMWWVIFNNPEFCSVPCGSDDVNDVDVQGSLVRAAGHVVGGSGRAGFASYLTVGDTRNILSGPGLLNPLDAEIHLVIRSHGAAIPGMIPEQISTFNGGCLPGQPNEGQCQNVQASIHEP